MFDPATSKFRRVRTVVQLLLLLAIVVAVLLSTRVTLFDPQVTLGAIAEVALVESGLTFDARVDTGASASSVHCLQFEITDEADEPQDNRGKAVRFQIENGRGEQAWIETEIVDYSKVKSVDATTGRYYVRLLLRCEGIEKEALVTLHDRSRMRQKLLLGREFLEGDFLVDVSQ